MQTLKDSHSPKAPQIDRGDVERLPALRPGFCDQCAIALPKSARNHHARFCSAPCRERWWRVAKTRGAKLYQHAPLWRRYRGRKGSPGAGRMGLMAQLIDGWLKSDRGDV